MLGVMSFEYVRILLRVFLSFFMFVLIFDVINFKMCCGIGVFLSWYFLFKIVICVLKFGGWMFVISFYLKWEWSLFFNVFIFFGGLFDESIIFLFVLYSVLNVWKNFFWVFFFLFKNWMLLIKSMLMFLYLSLNLFVFLFFIAVISLFVNIFDVIYIIFVLG